jgi:hypothetical protein
LINLHDGITSKTTRDAISTLFIGYKNRINNFYLIYEDKKLALLKIYLLVNKAGLKKNKAGERAVTVC